VTNDDVGRPQHKATHMGRTLGSVFKPQGTPGTITHHNVDHDIYLTDGVAGAAVGSAKKIKISGRERRRWQIGTVGAGREG